MSVESQEELKLGALRHSLRELVRAIGPVAALYWWYANGLPRVPIVGPHNKID